MTLNSIQHNSNKLQFAETQEINQRTKTNKEQNKHTIVYPVRITDVMNLRLGPESIQQFTTNQCLLKLKTQSSRSFSREKNWDKNFLLQRTKEEEDYL